MLKKMLAFALLITLITSCSSKSALNYSNDIVAKEKSLEPVITQAESSVVTFAQQSNFDSIAAVGERTEKAVQQKIDEIEAMKVPNAKEVDNFKAASITYFKFLKSIYTKYKEIGKAATDEERQTLVQLMQEMVAKKSTVIADMQSAQRKFASANNFKVQ